MGPGPGVQGTDWAVVVVVVLLLLLLLLLLPGLRLQKRSRLRLLLQLNIVWPLLLCPAPLVGVASSSEGALHFYTQCKQWKTAEMFYFHRYNLNEVSNLSIHVSFPAFSFPFPINASQCLFRISLLSNPATLAG